MLRPGGRRSVRARWHQLPERHPRSPGPLPRQGGNGIISIPLRRKEDIVGVLTLEFAPGQHLGPQASTGLSVAADLLAPQLYDRYQNDRWLITKAGISTREGIKTVIGPKYWIAKLCVAGAILVVMLICNWIPFVDLTLPYRVSAQFQFAPMERRLVSSPFDGMIDSVQKRPGDPVKAGDSPLHPGHPPAQARQSQG